jgi:glucose/arabinose dehydrogenase
VRSRLVLLAVLAALIAGGALALVLRGDDGEANDERPQRPAPATPERRDARERENAGAVSARVDCPPPGPRRGGGVALQRIGSFDEPLYVTAPPGDCKRLFVVEKGGRIRLLLNGKRVRRPFLDLSGQVTTGGEQGLLSMAFAPDYSRSGRFYVDYTDRDGDTRVQEFRRSRRSPNRANRSTRRPLLFVDQPFENHNGGLLLFGPDRLLYIGLGDGGAGGDPGNRAQNLDTLLGKLLRIDPRSRGKRYRSPRSNPLVGRAGRNEIYAYGLRNPWRFSFDSKTGDLYIGDVGQNEVEEVDYARRGQARGRNYGWSCFEGRLRFNGSRSCPGAVGPVLTYPLSGGNCAVTGGVVVRDPALPQLAGHYLYGDFCGGQVRSFRIEGGRATGDRSLGLNVSSLSSFGEDAGGGVYLTSLEGPVYRLVSR